jgi:hypothetical protein
MSVERSRQLGQALMGASVLSLLMFLAGMTRRSYVAVAVPVAAGLGVIAALTFWVGYTMATTEWENDEVEGASDESVPASDAEPQATAAEPAAERSAQ